MTLRFGTIVGIRRLRETESPRKLITVKLGKPRKKQKEWVCPFQIAGVGGQNVEYGHGIDALQALVMAIEGIRTRLEQTGKRFTWQGGDPGDSGFPRFVPSFFGLAFSKRLEQLIDSETNRFARAAERQYRRKQNKMRKKRARKGRSLKLK